MLSLRHPIRRRWFVSCTNCNSSVEYFLHPSISLYTPDYPLDNRRFLWRSFFWPFMGTFLECSSLWTLYCFIVCSLFPETPFIAMVLWISSLYPLFYSRMAWNNLAITTRCLLFSGRRNSVSGFNNGCTSSERTYLPLPDIIKGTSWYCRHISDRTCCNSLSPARLGRYPVEKWRWTADFCPYFSPSQQSELWWIWLCPLPDAERNQWNRICCIREMDKTGRDE